jgi:hypothetical protein
MASVADLGCLSRILDLDFFIPDPESGLFQPGIPDLGFSIRDPDPQHEIDKEIKYF